MSANDQGECSMSDDNRITNEQARKWALARGPWQITDPGLRETIEAEIERLRKAGFEITPPDPELPYYIVAGDQGVEVRTARDEYGPATEGDLVVTTHHVNERQEWRQARELALREAERRNAGWAGEIADDDIAAACSDCTAACLDERSKA